MRRTQSQMQDAQARTWAEMVVAVRSGKLSAKEAASRLGVSRKTYYKKEARALSGMIGALGAREGGRPLPERDLEKEKLQEQLQKLEKENQVLRQSLEIQHLLDLPEKKSRPRGHPNHEHDPRKNPVVVSEALPAGGTASQPVSSLEKPLGAGQSGGEQAGAKAPAGAGSDRSAGSDRAVEPPPPS